MTTLEPGASDVFTHGLRVSPRSTAFLASSAAPIMTDGLDVLVHDVIAAMTTAPWSRSTSPPSGIDTSIGLDVRPWAPVAQDGIGGGVWSAGAAGSEAGKDSADASSWESWTESPST